MIAQPTNLPNAVIRILTQLTEVVEETQPGDFCKPSDALGGSTVGQHVRHTVEFFFCLQAGYETGIVSYDKRPHDRRIETDRALALSALKQAIEFVKSFRHDKALKLEVVYNDVASSRDTIETTAIRELVYNLEHAVHHMAIIRIALREVAPYVAVDRNFGVAASTIRHHGVTVTGENT